MDYLSAKFGNFRFSSFGFIVRTDKQNHRQKDRITEAADRTVDVSNYHGQISHQPTASLKPGFHYPS